MKENNKLCDSMKTPKSILIRIKNIIDKMFRYRYYYI